MPDCPPSLDPAVVDRAWKAANGELAFLATDVDLVLDACEHDGVAVLGWELWLLDHWLDENNILLVRPGIWTGLIPDPHGAVGVWASNADLHASREEIRRIDWRSQVAPELHPFVRYNFTFDG